jgi:hypothetical protein
MWAPAVVCTARPGAAHARGRPQVRSSLVGLGVPEGAWCQLPPPQSFVRRGAPPRPQAPSAVRQRRMQRRAAPPPAPPPAWAPRKRARAPSWAPRKRARAPSWAPRERERALGRQPRLALEVALRPLPAREEAPAAPQAAAAQVFPPDLSQCRSSPGAPRQRAPPSTRRTMDLRGGPGRSPSRSPYPLRACARPRSPHGAPRRPSDR